MLATVTNSINEMSLWLRLITIDGKMTWQDVETGHVCMQKFDNAEAAMRGLRNFYARDAGTRVRFQSTNPLAA